MIDYKERRSFERESYNTPVNFSVLFTESDNLKKINTDGTIINGSTAGIGIITNFPLEAGHVLEWDDLHKEGNLHIASVRWSQNFGNYYRAGAMFI